MVDPINSQFELFEGQITLAVILCIYCFAGPHILNIKNEKIRKVVASSLILSGFLIILHAVYYMNIPNIVNTDVSPEKSMRFIILFKIWEYAFILIGLVAIGFSVAGFSKKINLDET